MDPRIEPLIGILSTNAGAYGLALDGVDQASAERRPNDRTNSLAYLACHALDARYFLMGMCGHQMTNPWRELFDSSGSVGDMKEYPPTYELRTVWDEVHEATVAHLATLGDEELAADTGHGFPYPDKSLLGAITFLTFHESYHIGQMGLIRKFVGFESIVPG